MWSPCGLEFQGRALERTWQEDSQLQQLRTIDSAVLYGHTALILPMMAHLHYLWRAADTAEASQSALKALVLLWTVLLKNCGLLWMMGNGHVSTYLRVKRVALYAATVLATPFLSTWYMLAGGRVWSCSPPSVPFWLLEINAAHVPAVVLHALVFRLPFPAALATNGLAVALFIAFDPAVCKGGHTLCAAGSAAKQRLAAWLRQRLGTWLIKPAGDAGWQGLLAECTRVQAWWQLCALAAAMQLVWCRERVERLAWVKRQEATDADHAAALSAAARRLERAARPASRVLLELAVSAVAAWLLVDMLL